MVKAFTVVAAFVFLSFTSRAVDGAVSASPNNSQPSQSTNYILTGSGGSGTFEVSENVSLDFAAGPWSKSFVNGAGSSIPSGSTPEIDETLTNTGALTWTGWHEAITSRTSISQPNDAPGFLFRHDTLVLTANYGSGDVALQEGVDYTLVTTPYSGPGDPGNNSHWEAIDITFAANRQIETGDILHLQKGIFEVFGDANVWQPGEAAVVSEFPTPEPASAIGGITMVTVLLAQRRGRNRR
jgi:hypothetical protein